MGDLEEMLSGAMSDPRFAGILSSLKEKADSGELNVKEMLGDLSGGDAAASAQPAPAGTASPAPAGMNEHKKLLSALRPYLADKKRSAVDEILKIGEFSGIIEALSKNKDGGR